MKISTVALGLALVVVAALAVHAEERFYQPPLVDHLNDYEVQEHAENIVPMPSSRGPVGRSSDEVRFRQKWNPLKSISEGINKVRGHVTNAVNKVSGHVSKFFGNGARALGSGATALSVTANAAQNIGNAINNGVNGVADALTGKGGKPAGPAPTPGAPAAPAPGKPTTPGAPAPAPVATGTSPLPNGKTGPTAADVEDCVACRFIWLQVELKVGNDQIEENIYDAFTQSCIEAQKAPIFYPACEDMFDDVYGMIGDYMEGRTVNQMCEAAKLCR